MAKNGIYKISKASLVVLILLCAVGVVSYSVIKLGEKGRQKLSTDLEEAILKNKAGEDETVDFSPLTSFSWDRLYVFAPYTTYEKIDAALGKHWLGSRFTEIESSDRITLLVFTSNGQVVQYLEFPRSKGDFSFVANEMGYPISKAQFTVDEKGRMVWAFAN